MSNKAQEGRIVVPLESIIAELNEVKKYIDTLQAHIDQITSELNEINSSRNFLSELKTSKPKELIIPTDRRGYVLAKVQPTDLEKVLVHIGLDFYAEVNLEKASEILTIIEKDLKEGVRNLQQELSRALGYYQHLQNIVNQALAKIQQARTSR